MTIKEAKDLARDFTSVKTLDDIYQFVMQNCTKWFNIYDLEEELIEFQEDYERLKDKTAFDTIDRDSNYMTIN